MNFKKNKFLIPILVVAVIVALFVWIIWSNKALELNIYTINASDVPDNFNGYRIAHVSDLHNAEIGYENVKLINMLKDADPDIIVITGDIIDSRNTDIDVAYKFVLEAMGIAPCYYVTGNHESRINEYDKLKDEMISAGVYVLDDSSEKIEILGDEITLIGINDPSFETNYPLDDAASIADSKLSDLSTDEEEFTVLLSHRPELFETYVEHDVDLVFSGHAHGGQFRLPIIGGLVAPNQGFFPEYDSGIFSDDNTKMVVSRGVGNSIFPFRVNNRPEVILIELQSQ